MQNHSLFHTVPQKDAPKFLNVIVEISEGDYNKYEYDHELGVLKLDRVLYGPMFYPINYCDIPGTWNAHDNDPLDAILFSTQPIVPGALVRGKVIGAMEMIDNGEIDHKIICVNDRDPRYEHVKTVDDLTPYDRKDVSTFFQLYKVPQTGRDSVQVGKFIGPDEAAVFIKECIDSYAKKFGGKTK